MEFKVNKLKRINRVIAIMASVFIFNNALASQTIEVNPFKQDMSPPLREISSSKSHPKIPTIIQHNNVSPIHHFQKIEDTVLQYVSTKQTLLKLFVFQGMGIGLNNYTIHYAPANANGSVGLTQYVQWVNADMAVFDKTTGTLAAGFPKSGNSLWAGFGGVCETTNKGQPIVKYDQLANRWVITQTAFTNINSGPFFQCVAISTTGDATGSYYRYAYQFNEFNDDPKLSLWPDAYYMTFKLKNGPLVCAADRNKMLSGLNATLQCIPLSYTNTSILLPADFDGLALPPTGTPGYFMGIKAPNNLIFYRYHVDFNNSKNSVLSGPTAIFVANFTPSCAATAGAACAIQPGTTTLLDTLSDRLMHRLAYRQFAAYGSLVATHTIQGPAPKLAPAIRWYELRFLAGDQIPTVYQQASFTPDSMNRFIGSIAMDKFGNIALGYTVSSSLVHPSPELAWRNATDHLNTLSYYQPLITGLGSQINLSRWGDYNSMSLDPSDDCTFWYTNQYLKTNGSFNWSTSIISFKLPGCI